MCPLEALYMECGGFESHGGKECSALSIHFNCNSVKYTRCSPTLQYFYRYSQTKREESYIAHTATRKNRVKVPNHW